MLFTSASSLFKTPRDSLSLEGIPAQTWKLSVLPLLNGDSGSLCRVSSLLKQEAHTTLCCLFSFKNLLVPFLERSGRKERQQPAFHMAPDMCFVHPTFQQGPSTMLTTELA